MAITQQQLDAILDAREDRPGEFGGLPPEKVAEELAREGHPAFAAVGDVPFDAGPRRELAPEGARLPAKAEEPPQTTALATQHQGDSGTGLDMGEEDFEVPAIKIKQGQTRVEGGTDVPEGHLFVSVDPEGHAAERKLVLLANTRGRSFWLSLNEDAAAATAERVFKISGIELPHKLKGPVCASRDRITPEPSEHGTLSDKCKGCAYTAWREVRGERKPPDCGESHTLLVADVTDGVDSPQPAIFRASKTAYRPVRKLLNMLAVAARRHKVDGRPRHVAGLAFTMSTKGEDNPKVGT